MSAKDLYHDAFVHALQKDGWTITHDPLTVGVGKTDVLIDLGAERMIAAEREGEKIAVEIKSFVKLSAVQDLKEAVGQFVLYAGALPESPEMRGVSFIWQFVKRRMPPFLRRQLVRCCFAIRTCP